MGIIVLSIVGIMTWGLMAMFAILALLKRKEAPKVVFLSVGGNANSKRGHKQRIGMRHKRVEN